MRGLLRCEDEATNRGVSLEIPFNLSVCCVDRYTQGAQESSGDLDEGRRQAAEISGRACEQAPAGARSDILLSTSTIQAMGILGLTTFLRENKRTLLKQIRVDGSAATVLVVDGWSYVVECPLSSELHSIRSHHRFIYYLYQSTHAAWVYGGEYEDFYTSITSVVKAWLQVGFKLHFVFDGPSPDSVLQIT